MGEAGGALVWFAVPRFKPGEFGGVFTLALDALPVPGPGRGRRTLLAGQHLPRRCR